jgi:hypothetical protein
MKHFKEQPFQEIFAIAMSVCVRLCTFHLKVLLFDFISNLQTFFLMV